MNLMQELFDHVRVADKELEEQGPAERKTFRGEPFGVYASRRIVYCTGLAQAGGGLFA